MFHGMKIYTVHVRPDTQQAQEKPIFLREGFNWMAFFFGGFWALYHRLWWYAAVIVFVNIALGLIAKEGILSRDAMMAVQLGFQAIVGFYANDWLRAKLEKRGYVFADVTAADSELRAEQRYFERALAAH